MDDHSIGRRGGRLDRFACGSLRAATHPAMLSGQRGPIARISLLAALSVLAAAGSCWSPGRRVTVDEWLTTMHNRGHDALHHALDPVIAKEAVVLRNAGSGLKEFMEGNHEQLVPQVTAHDLEDDLVEGIKDTLEGVEHGIEDAVEGLKDFEEESHQALEPDVPASEVGHLLEEHHRDLISYLVLAVLFALWAVVGRSTASDRRAAERAGKDVLKAVTSGLPPQGAGPPKAKTRIVHAV